MKMITVEKACCVTDDPDLPVQNFETTTCCKITGMMQIIILLHATKENMLNASITLSARKQLNENRETIFIALKVSVEH